MPAAGITWLVFVFLFAMAAPKITLTSEYQGRGQLSLKVPNIEFNFDVGFSMYLYLLTKPNVEIKNYESLS